jgi:hypothetical protein
MSKKTIGVIGEHPNNDSEALIALLQKYVLEDWELKLCDLKGLRGTRLDNYRDFQAMLLLEKTEESYERFIIVRDLDSLEKDKTKIKQKESWFRRIKQIINDKSYFFLVIYELEALMLCDIETLNRFFQTNIQYEGSPIQQPNPKEFIISATQNTPKGKYQENFATPILTKIDFYKLYQNHQGKHSFQAFADHLKEEGLIDF